MAQVQRPPLERFVDRRAPLDLLKRAVFELDAAGRRVIKLLGLLTVAMWMEHVCSFAENNLFDTVITHLLR
jgi:hypothetical protein